MSTVDRTHVRIGSGAGFAGDRIAPAVDLVRDGQLDDLVLECLAERTIALGQRRRRADPTTGHDDRTSRRLRALLPEALPRGTRIVSNLGAANPAAAARETVAVAEQLGLRCRVAAVTGDDVLAGLDLEQPSLEHGRPLSSYGEIISANAYTGAATLMAALDTGAEVVLAGRVADPSLFVAPLAHRLGWDLDDPALAAHGTLVGHLLECGTQVSGGYFADPTSPFGAKGVPDLAHVGLPWADVSADGTATLGTVDGTGGRLDRATVREQLLYEISDPGAYLTPDVTLDLYGVRLETAGPNRVRVSGARGRPAPEQLKVSVGYAAGYRAEGGISYAGPGCVARARLAGEVVATRLAALGITPRVDVVGAGTGVDLSDTRLRVAATAPDADTAREVCDEVEALYVNGPAGGGGVRTRVEEVIGIVSTLVDRSAVRPHVDVLETR